MLEDDDAQAATIAAPAAETRKRVRAVKIIAQLREMCRGVLGNVRRIAAIRKDFVCCNARPRSSAVYVRVIVVDDVDRPTHTIVMELRDE